MIGIETWIGLIAAALTALANIPQIVKVWRTGEADDIAWGMICLLGAGLSAWIIYGLLRNDLVVAGSNGVGLSLLALLSALKARSPRKA